MKLSLPKVFQTYNLRQTDINIYHLGETEIVKVVAKLYVFVKGLLQKDCLITTQNFQKVFV